MPPAKKKSGSSRRGAKPKPPLAEGPAEPILHPRGSKVPGQDSDFLTTAQGQRLAHTDDSLKAGDRGPTLMEDFHLREKIMHFDHERIPERVVHARGVGGARRVRGRTATRPTITQRRLPAGRAASRRCSPGSRPWSAHAARPTPCATSAASR